MLGMLRRRLREELARLKQDFGNCPHCGQFTRRPQCDWCGKDLEAPVEHPVGDALRRARRVVSQWGLRTAWAAVRRHIAAELAALKAEFANCPHCGGYTRRPICDWCGRNVEEPAEHPVLDWIKAQLQLRRDRYTVCPRCAQWTPRGHCAWCGTSTEDRHVRTALGDRRRFPDIAARRRLLPLYSILRGVSKWDPQEQWGLLRHLVKWLALASLVGVLSGTASAFFLHGLAWVTAQREAAPWLLWGLPVAGFLVGYVYHRWGDGSERGNNLVLETIHSESSRVPLRMAPLVLMGTLITHLFGGSAGREGSAVQMGGSLADRVARFMPLTAEDRQILLMSGMAGGFGSVFGTPLAGAIFGVEVLEIGALRYQGLIACLTSSFVANLVTQAWGVHHPEYLLHAVPAFSAVTFGKTVLIAIAFGLAALAFSAVTHGLKAAFRALLPYPPLRPVAGGVAVIAMTYLVGSTAYLGLSLPLIQTSFSGTVPAAALLLKLLFTAVTLGAGFQGGEVTPLFVIGATLGNALSGPLGLPADLAAAMGFVAVFAAAANTPLACMVMAVELFGSTGLPYIALAGFVAYVVSGHSGIYTSQRVATPKHAALQTQSGSSLHRIHQARSSVLPAMATGERRRERQ